MEPLFERREYENGTQYWAAVAQPIPGQVYYVRRVDEANQIYYSQQTYFPPGMGTNAFATGMYLQQTNFPNNSPNNNYNNYNLNGVSPISAEEMSGLHLGINVTALFFPTLLYLIGFPFCHVRMKKYVQQFNQPALTAKLNSYVGVGWTCYVLHLFLLVTFCTFWIPSCNTSYNYDYNYGYYSYYLCRITTGGIVSISVVPALVLIFQITIIAIGADIINTAKRSGVSGYSVVTTVPGIQAPMVGTLGYGYVGAAGMPAGSMAARV